ncbi:MAG: hypothetical protein ABII01_06115 [Candidatus Woesearchaeota archaeon]
MGDELNIFGSVEYLEPKCSKCNNKIDYGITTTWDEKEQAHKCNSCGEFIK